MLGNPVLRGADSEGRHPGALDGVQLVAEVAHDVKLKRAIYITVSFFEE